VKSRSWWWLDRATIMLKLSDTYATYCQRSWHRHWRAAWYWRGWTTVTHGSHTSSIQTLQRVQNNATRIVLQAPRWCHANPLMRQLHWLPVRHRINYKLAVMTYKIHSTSLPAYLSHHINPRETTWTLRSSDTLLFTVPFTRTELAKRAFRCSAPPVWNSLPSLVTNSDSDDLQISAENLLFPFSFRL